jgi:peptidoglycan/xylan/chitin deacetylase (PgdA/CDA1 family)
MKKFLKNLIYKILSNFCKPGIVVLMYHSVDRNSEFFTVSPENFERQMEFLKNNNFEVVQLTSLIGGPEKLKNKKVVVITFDDGYEDNYLNALPILKKFGFPVTIFVSTDNIGKSIIAKKGSKLNIVSLEQIKEMAKNGISFGSHGKKHIAMRNINEKELETDLFESKKILSGLTGENTETFAYPFGVFDNVSFTTASKIFKIICTVEKGRIDIRGKDFLFKIKRNSIDSFVSFQNFKAIAKIGRL